MTKTSMGPAMDVKGVIASNAIASFIVKVVTNVFRLFLPPIILKTVTIEEYGIWACCFILIGYVGMGAFGVTNVYVRHGAIYAGQERVDWISRLVSTGMVVVGSFSVVVLVLLYFLIPYVIQLFHISPELTNVATTLFFWSMVIFCLDLTLGVFGCLLMSLQRIVQEQIISLAGSIVEMILVVVFLYSGFGVYSLLYAFVIRFFFVLPLQMIYCYRYLPQLKVRFYNFDKTMLSFFFKYGGIVQLAAVLGTVATSIHKLIAGVFLGARATGLVELGDKLPSGIEILVGSINMVFLPAASHLYARGEHSKLIQLHLKGSRYVNVLLGLAMGFLLPFSGPVVTCWLGADPKFALVSLILACYILPHQFHVMTGPATAIFRSDNRPQIELWNAIPRIVLIVGVCVPGLWLFGWDLMFLVVVSATIMLLCSLFFLFYSNYMLGVGQWLFMKMAMLPGLVPFAFGYLTYWCFYEWISASSGNRWELIPVVLSALAVYSVVTIVFLYWVVFPRKERAFFLAHLFKRWRKSEQEAIAEELAVQPILEDDVNIR